jgi:protein-tyrosine phosphatase
MHCHLLAGLDDGPATDEEALAMCRMAYDEGTRLASATAHQNERWASVTPDRIRHATRRLTQRLHDDGIPLTVFPCAEVMVHPTMHASWLAGDLLSVGDHGQYLLMELPPGLVMDVHPLVKRLQATGVRPILAHPERQDDLIDDPDALERLVRAGCLVQVSAGSVTDPRSREREKNLREWFKRGLVHLVGSDGHSTGRRSPRISAAYQRIRRWAGNTMADRVCSTNGMAILQGLKPKFPEPTPRCLRWWANWW